MAELDSSGNQSFDRASPAYFTIHEDIDGVQSASSSLHNTALGLTPAVTPNDCTIPLVSTKLGNAQLPNSRHTPMTKKLKPNYTEPLSEPTENSDSMNTLLAKLSEQQALLEQQKNALASNGTACPNHSKEDAVSDPLPVTSNTEGFNGAVDKGSENDETVRIETHEMERLKKELDVAKDRIARQEQELSQTRIIKHAFNNVKNGTHVTNTIDPDSVDRTIASMQDAFSATRPVFPQGNHEDSRSDASEQLSVGAIPSRGGNIWTNSHPSNYNSVQSVPSIWCHNSNRAWVNRSTPSSLPQLMIPPHHQMRNYSGPGSPGSATNSRYFSGFSQYPSSNGTRRNSTQSGRNGAIFAHGGSNGWDSYGSNGEGSPVMGMSPASYQPIGMFQAPIGYQPRPIGTPLSPTAAEFMSSPGGPWNTTPSSPGQTYVSPMEPLNYRRLLDRSVTCNWKFIVDKIVCNNDQQASIFLQQKLKVGTVEQKFEIVEAIVAQAYPLMVNRFGNFLVQRCFEHGTPEQVVAIANAIRGNTLSLSMDAFGCHVVQKAFDAVPEEYKAIMVHELLRRIPETVIHRYACHVWQKLFELRWSDSPPQIMKYVNEALRGMWHEVALGETGSLVVQNIFENCLEEDKRPCINEVLQSIDIVAHGQFGNWCIQHICEHGAPTDRSRAVDHVLRYATEYSMDQFASKVVEKCLKIGGAEFLERYLDRVCEGRPDRPRIPLIDISSDQYGNYLIQYILTHADGQHRETVASHIRKHMVSLRGSKFGSRVGLLCCNPAYATCPGPAVAAPVNRFNGASNLTNNRYGGQFR